MIQEAAVLYSRICPRMAEHKAQAEWQIFSTGRLSIRLCARRQSEMSYSNVPENVLKNPT